MKSHSGLNIVFVMIFILQFQHFHGYEARVAYFSQKTVHTQAVIFMPHIKTSLSNSTCYFLN